METPGAADLARRKLTAMGSFRVALALIVTAAGTAPAPLPDEVPP
jgi:hypothetical protein